MHTHCFVHCRLIFPAAVKLFGSAAVKGFFSSWESGLGWSYTRSTSPWMDMDLTSNTSDLPQKHPIFWTNLSTQHLFYQPTVCCFHQRRNVEEERRVAFSVYQVYLCGRCPLTCQMVRLSHGLGTLVEQSKLH